MLDTEQVEPELLSNEDLPPLEPEQLMLPLPELSLLQKVVIRSTESLRLSAQGTAHYIGDRPILSAAYYSPFPPGKAPIIIIGSMAMASWEHRHKIADNLRDIWSNTYIHPDTQQLALPEYAKINTEKGRPEIGLWALGKSLLKEWGKFYLTAGKPAVEMAKPYMFPLSLTFAVHTADVSQITEERYPTYDERYVSHYRGERILSGFLKTGPL